MEHQLTIYNSLSRTKELFTPLIAGKAGLYVCGPTVYSNAHLGHARPAITFDLLYRTLTHLGYKVRYVRNITDVGHLEDEFEERGEDKIVKKARLEQLEPMEVVQKYMNTFHRNMEELNTLPPSIEPRASGHIIEQLTMIRKIMDNGFAYQVNGSVYFDVEKYHSHFHYGILSGRNPEEMLANTRSLEGQDEKRYPFDFALWKKATPGHIMQWPSEWGMGFPGWHIECSAMSTKYLGEEFDIHGGGMDLQFPHHECEIAQSTAALGQQSVRYWMHNNMITINGQKMARSLGNFITLDELFSGNHPLLSSPFSPMTVRFFILQAHYRSTLDFSNEALTSARKGVERVMKGVTLLEKLPAGDTSTLDISAWEKRCMTALCDDLNTPVLIAHIFEGVKFINLISEGKESFTPPELERFKTLFKIFTCNILGLKPEDKDSDSSETISQLIELSLEIRNRAKQSRDWGTSDFIREELSKIGILVKDRKEGSDWEMKN